MPSIGIGAAAFGAGELVFHTAEKDVKYKTVSLKVAINKARETNLEIRNLSRQIEDKELVKNIIETSEYIDKIISTIEKKPEKYKKSNNFFEYYLPVTLNIIKKYDEIENQKINSTESEKFMSNTGKMICKIKDAFKAQLGSLYQSEMVDTDAEIKVFDAMLKADGYDIKKDF